MSYIIICKRDNKPQLHVYKPNTMSIWGEPYIYADKEAAMAEAQEWATIYKGVHPDYKVLVKKVEPPAPPARKIIRRAEPEPVRRIIRRSV